VTGPEHLTREPGTGRFLSAPAISLCLMLAHAGALLAGEGSTYHCATGEEVHRALDAAGPGDTIQLEGGKVYEIGESFRLRADGAADARITFTSKDPAGRGRPALISTIDGRKEPRMTAILVSGSFWHISRIEITGTKVPLGGGYWDTNGFQLGLYLLGPGSHHNLVEDVHIHHTHNAAVAVRDDSHHNNFRRMHIHHIGEWPDRDYNAHEAEGFYLGSSKGIAEGGNKARIHDILIEDNVLGPGVLGQYVDIKYAASRVTVRNNVFHCHEKTYNAEIIKVAGYANLVEDNRFFGSNERLTRYIQVLTRKIPDPVRVDYRGEKGIPAPSGRDNSILGNVFYTNDPQITEVINEVTTGYRSSVLVDGNRIEQRTQ
jgi:hypothetical protein